MKVKNKKTKLADMFTNRQKKKSPFEIHINRSKQNVLGRKIKTEKGLPGVSRSKAINKRKETLLQEFKIKDKDNLFYDKRIGEKKKSMTEEEKTMKRFVAERMKKHKKSIFNLNDEEILTHRGQSLMEIENCDNPRSDDEDSDDDKSNPLYSHMVDEAHFGGGLFEKVTDQKKSHKDVIETLIAESKKRKAEKKKMKEETMDLTDKLDEQWKDLLPLVAATTKTDKDKQEEKKAVDDYDKLVMQMKISRRATAGEKLKSEEDAEKEEKEKIEKLEKERLRRMEDEEEQKKQEKKHKSADDLDFDYLVEKIEDTDDEVKEDEEDEEREDEKGEEDEGEEEGSEEELEYKENGENISNDNEEDEKNQESENEAEESDEENSSESEDDLADLKASSSDEEEREEEEMKPKRNEVKKVNHVSLLEAKESVIKTSEEVKDNDKNLTAKFKCLKTSYEIVSTVDELEQILLQFDAEQKGEIISRMIKGNDKTSGYKEKFNELFGVLLQYLSIFANKCTTDEDVIEMFQMCNVICPHLYNLVHANPEEASAVFKAVIKTKHEHFEANINNYPGLDTIILFKIASLIYPSSDFRHPIMTPCHIFMTQILLKCKIKHRSDLSKGLFICTILLENTILSKRFAPSVLNFLQGILYTSLQKDDKFDKCRTVPPFKTFGPEKNILCLETSFENKSIALNKMKMRSSDLINEEIDENFKLRIVATTIMLLNEFVDLLTNLEAAYAVFKPIQKIFELDFLHNYPLEIRKIGLDVQEKLKNIERELEYLQFPKKKPKVLKLYEPKIEPVYEGKRNRPESKELAERQKMVHKLKQERKNAKREIRRDNAFLAKVRISQQIKSDEERKRKVKEIFGDAAVQQCELKKLKKK